MVAVAPARGAIEAAHAAISDAICSCRFDNLSGLDDPAPPPKIVITVARVLDVMPTSLEGENTSPHCDTPLPISVKVTVADTGRGVPVTTLLEHYNQLFRTLCKPAPSEVHLRDPLFVMTTVASDIVVRAYEMRTADLPSEGALVILQCPCIEKTQETRISGTTLSFEAEGHIEELLVFIHDQFNAISVDLQLQHFSTVTLSILRELSLDYNVVEEASSMHTSMTCSIPASSFLQCSSTLEHFKEGVRSHLTKRLARYGLDYERAFISSPGRADMTFKNAGLTGKRLEIFVHEIGACILQSIDE
eukprot:SM000042S15410  [mRNA]  locus=s42:763370:765875:- [translate_table: standard]